MSRMFAGAVAAAALLAAAGAARAQGGVPVGPGPEVVVTDGGCGACGADGCKGCKGCGKGQWFPGLHCKPVKVEPSYQVQTPYDIYQRRCGLHPLLKKCLGIATDLPPPPPPASPSTGTLVFPNHPFARSPRDYFMEECDY